MKFRPRVITASVLVGLFAFQSANTYAANLAPTYLLPSSNSVSLKVLATAGDRFAGSIIPGIPDGMGAHTNGNMMTVLSVFEHSTSSSFVKTRENKSAPWGASITEFSFSPRLKAFTSANTNFIKNINFWNYTTSSWVADPTNSGPANSPAGTFGWGINRFCSAYMAPAGTFLYKDGNTTLGYDGALFFSGEEAGDASRAFAFEMDGTGYQFARAGTASWENIVVSGKPGKNTVVLGLEDGSATNSHLHMYVGTKTATGNAFEKAGLNNGKLYVLNVPTAATDNVFRTAIGKNKSTPVTFKEVNWNQTVADFDKSVTAEGSEFARIEDGEFDPNNPNVFYFLTTESNKDLIATAPNPATPTVTRDGGGLWRLTFKDAQNPLLGAELELLLNGGENIYMSKPDNMAITKNGVIMIQEDPGNNDHVARVVAYRIKDAKLATVAAFSSELFAKGAAKLMTVDEESSGIIDVTSMMAKKGDTNTYFLLNAQVHTTGVIPARPDLAKRSEATKTKLNNVAVEGGQFYLMTVSDWNSVFSS
ncbi:MAG: DUF839 domain-containing protein [Actinobacteria bacterium]|nr:DUF839 domain-containing protein [Actinomycetota bacterium]